MTDERQAALAAPRTQAGRDLAADLDVVAWFHDDYRGAILAIEAEAATLDVERLARALAKTYSGARLPFRGEDGDWRSDAEYVAREYDDGGEE